MYIGKTNAGLRICIDSMKEVDTVSIMLGVKTGSRNENANNNGISHFLEHMAFKGTKNRSYLDIAEAIDNVGGIINAATSKERTVYYVKLMKEDLELGIDIISDIVQNSTFPQEEIEKERGVILQELSASLDTPDDVVFDYFYETAFKSSSLSSTILGPADNINKLQKSDFENYLANRYSVQNSVLSVCGNVDEVMVGNMAEKYFKNMQNNQISDTSDGQYCGGEYIKHKEDLEQMQCVIGFKSVDYITDDVYKVGILSSILGGGMSSRLFQEIREKRGLAYTISCWNDSYSDCGVFTVYAGTSPDKTDELASSVAGEMLKICENITDNEMQRVIKQTQASIVMSKESTNSRSRKACTDLMHIGRYVDYKEIVDKISAVTKQDLYDIAKTIFASKPTLTLYGNTKGVKSNLETLVGMMR